MFHHHIHVTAINLCETSNGGCGVDPCVYNGPGRSSCSPLAEAVGGAVGGFTFLALFAILALVLLARRRRKAGSKTSSKDPRFSLDGTYRENPLQEEGSAAAIGFPRRRLSSFVVDQADTDTDNVYSIDVTEARNGEAPELEFNSVVRTVRAQTSWSQEAVRHVDDHIMFLFVLI